MLTPGVVAAWLYAVRSETRPHWSSVFPASVPSIGAARTIGLRSISERFPETVMSAKGSRVFAGPELQWRLGSQVRLRLTLGG